MSQQNTEILNQISKYWYKEGHLNLDQRDLFVDLLKTRRPKFCLEIGFASGRSAVTTLIAARPQVLVSVDLSLDYIPGARAHAVLLQQNFPNLEIVEGDSKQVLTGEFFASNFPNGLDFGFIDGDHSFTGCYSDLKAIFPYLNPNSIILVDDYRSGPPNGVTCPDVTRAVDDFVLKNGLAIEYWNKAGKGIAVIKRPNSVIERLGTLSGVLLRMQSRKAKDVARPIRRRLENSLGSRGRMLAAVVSIQVRKNGDENQLSRGALNCLNQIKSSRAFLKKLVAKVRYVYTLLVPDKETRRFIAHNRKTWSNWGIRHGDSVVLTDFYSVGETNIARSYFLNVLAKRHNAAIKTFSSNAMAIHSALYKVYQSFNAAGHIVTSLNQEQECRKKAISRQVIPGLKTKQDVFDLNVLGVWIGIDIYESYLRNNKPTVFLDDPRLFELVEEGIGLVIFWQDFFAKKVAAVVLSHDCYLHFNVVAKVAYQNHVPVYLPNARGLSLVDRPFATQAYFPEYRRIFSKLSTEEQASGIAWAKKQLERRFSGEVGVDMPYATKSAFRSSGDEKPVLRKSEKIKVLICTHCFYDNPHAYGDILFLDFYEWLRFLGGISERTNYDWYLKVHPDPLPGTLETVKGILAGFPRITLIPHETSHHQLVEEGIDFVLTVYGSVGHEYPASGVQVINAGYNPHVAYEFNWHPKSLEEYEYYLLNLDKLQKHINLEELYEFYYMHHHYVLADDLVFKSYRQVLSDLTTEERIGSAVYGYFLDQLTDVKHQEIIKNMRKFIDSGKPYYFSHGPE